MNRPLTDSEIRWLKAEYDGTNREELEFLIIAKVKFDAALPGIDLSPEDRPKVALTITQWEACQDYEKKMVAKSPNKTGPKSNPGFATGHAGEMAVGSYLESNFVHHRWTPSTGKAQVSQDFVIWGRHRKMPLKIDVKTTSGFRHGGIPTQLMERRESMKRCTSHIILGCRFVIQPTEIAGPVIQLMGWTKKSEFGVNHEQLSGQVITHPYDDLKPMSEMVDNSIWTCDTDLIAST